jgi:DNA-binding transcriptional regulator YiaG
LTRERHGSTIGNIAIGYMKESALRRRRERLGLTQAALAEAMGVTWNTIARWETGQRRIPKIATILLRYLESDRQIKPKGGKG